MLFYLRTHGGDSFTERIGGRLLVNNSWSGSRVTKLPYYGKLFPSGCSDERTGGLGRDGVLPDIIIVFMGINDWAYGAPMNASDDYYSFENAYELMLKKLKANYPKADIQCVGIFPVYSLKNGAYELVDTVNGTTYEEVNRIIGRAAKRCRCGFLDSGDFSLAPDETIDGTHPNVKGMKRLADKLINVYE